MAGVRLIHVLFVAVGVQMVRIQHIPGAQQILDQSQFYHGVTQTIYPERGNIYDDQGRLLAGNETIYEVGIDLASVKQPETIATVASSVLGLDYMQTLTYAQMTPGGDNPVYVTLNVFVSKEKVAQLEIILDERKSRSEKKKHAPSGRLMWTPHDKRSYRKECRFQRPRFYGFLTVPGHRDYYGEET